MRIQPKKDSTTILIVLTILSWVAFVGYLIEAGVFVFSYFFSMINPDAARNFYNGLDLFELQEYSAAHYTFSAFFMIAVTLLKAYVASLAIKVLSTVSLKNPFTEEVASLIERIAYGLLGTWVIAMIGNAHTTLVTKKLGVPVEHWFDGDFIFMAGLVFIIAQIFKRGVELQSDQDLTV